MASWKYYHIEVKQANKLSVCVSLSADWHTAASHLSPVTTSPKPFCVTNSCPFLIWGPISWKTTEWCLYVRHWSTQAATYSSCGRSGYDLLECQVSFLNIGILWRNWEGGKARGLLKKRKAKCWPCLILLGMSSGALMCVYVLIKGLDRTFGTCYSVDGSLASGRWEMGSWVP